MDELTARQLEVLEFIRACGDRNGRPPTVREIAGHFRLASTHGVRRHLAALETKGAIIRQFNRARGIQLTGEYARPRGIPIIGRVAAGVPITAQENLEGYLSLESFLQEDAETFCLRVKSDSMIEAGIFDGDYVIVRAKTRFRDNEIGVAIIDGEATVKKLRRRGRVIELIPANEQFKPLRVDPSQCEFRYAGEVVSVHRKL